MPRQLLLAVIMLGCPGIARPGAAAELPPGATVLDSDILWDIANPHSFALSHDEKQIAYISKGAIWICSVTAGPPTKVADLPNTVTAILAEPGNDEQRELSNSSPHSPGYRPFAGPIHLDLRYVFSLKWAADDDGVFYTIMVRVRKDSPVREHHVMHASVKGGVTEIAMIEGSFGVPQEHRTSFHVTPDHKYVIASNYTPLIWDVAAGRPRATPYDLLVPSSTSGRFLGVEIDTRQLVLVDEQFQITKRFDIEFLAERRIELTWSDDELFVVCRTYDEYASRFASAVRVDLESGQKMPVGRCHECNQFVFTDQHGALLHLRVAGAYGEMGMRITAIDGEGDQRDLITTGVLRRGDKGQRGSACPPMIASHLGEFVAIPVPRTEDDVPGAQYHLVAAGGVSKPFRPVTNATYTAPYFPIAFVDGGRLLVARAGSHLFSLPVSAVTEQGGGDDEN